MLFSKKSGEQGASPASLQPLPMRIFFHKIFKLVRLQARFAMSGAIATAVDYGVYLSLVHRVLSPVAANTVSYPAGVLVNFFLHRNFVFKLQRPTYQAFGLSMLVSAGGMGISSAIIYLLSKNYYLNENQYITKLISAGIVFFYNFFFKRYVFEKRVFEVD